MKRRKDVRIDERLVNPLRLIIALLLLLCLLLKAEALLEGVVQFRICIAELLPAHEPLEALAEARAGAMPLGERRHDLRVADYTCISGEGVVVVSKYMMSTDGMVVTDEGGGYAKRLDELADELLTIRTVLRVGKRQIAYLIEHAGICSRFAAIDIMLNNDEHHHQLGI